LAILKHIARSAKKGYGSSEKEETRADMVAEWIKGHYDNKIFPWAYFPKFNKDAEARAAYYKDCFGDLATNMEKFLDQAGTGFLVGAELTYADLLAFDSLEVIEQTNEAALAEKPKLKAFLAKVRAVPAIAAYVAHRRKSDFSAEVAKP